MNQRTIVTQRGVTLVEASIALACFGLLMILIIAMVQRQNVQSRVIIQDSAVHRAQAAITAFAAMHGRLPCPLRSPDLDMSQPTEECGVSTVGYLPLRKLGLPMSAAAHLQYKVGEPSLMLESTQRLIAEQSSRIMTTVPDDTSTPETVETQMVPVRLTEFVGDATASGVRQQEFCQALLYTATAQVDPDDSSKPRQPGPAYGLMPIEGQNAPGEAAEAYQYTSTNALWTSLNCNQIRAHGLRANANVLAGMEFLKQSYDDRMKVWGSESAAYGLDAAASVTWVAQGVEKLFRHSGNFMAAEGVATCPYCAPSGAALVPSAAVFPMVVATEAPLIADAVKYSGQAVAHAALLGAAWPVKLSIEKTVADTTSGYKAALKTGAQY